MSLPKRDGVHNRYYLIHKPDTSPEVLAEADLCIQDVLNGTAREDVYKRQLLGYVFLLWERLLVGKGHSGAARGYGCL